MYPTDAANVAFFSVSRILQGWISPHKGDVRFGQKTLRFPVIFFAYKSKGANFCISVYHHIRQVVVQNFFQKGLIFPENGKNWISFVFTVLPIYVMIKSLLIHMSVCGRVVKLPDLRPSLTSHNRPITGSSPDGARLTEAIIFSLIFNQCTVS